MPPIATFLKSLDVQMKSFSQEFFQDAYPEDIERLSSDSLKQIAADHKGWSAVKTGQSHITIRNDEHPGMGATVDVVTEDLAFIVDSVVASLTDLGYEIELMIHPRMKNAAKDGHAYNSHMHLVLKKPLSKAQQAIVEQEIKSVLNDVRLSNQDWQKMRDRLLETKEGLTHAPSSRYSAAEIKEYQDFLDYLYEDNFTFLGCRSYSYANGKNVAEGGIVKKSGLGMLNDDQMPVFINGDETSLPLHLQALRKDLSALTIAKVNRKATVHRRVPLDAVIVKSYDEKGNLVGETLFVGLFTSVTYSRSLRSLPYLRFKANRILEKSGFAAGTHDYRALRHILEHYPRDELFQIEIDDLFDICMRILRVQERKRVSLYLRQDRFGRYVSALVYAPREKYDTRLRLRLQKVLEERLGGVCTSYASSLDDSMLARILFNITVPQFKKLNIDRDSIEAELQEVARGWDEMLRDALFSRFSDEQALSYDRMYSFPIPYQERNRPDNVPHDILMLESVRKEEKAAAFHLYRPKDASPEMLRLKAVRANEPLALSAIMPILENMGLWVVSEEPAEVLAHPSAGNSQSLWIQDFILTDKNAAKNPKDIAKIGAVFADALSAVWSGKAENDNINQLVFENNTPWEEVVILRACTRYINQLQTPYSPQFLIKCLTDFPAISAGFINLFKARFDPALKGNRDKAQADADAKILTLLKDVPGLDQDRVFRLYRGLITAILRTNFYQTDDAGQARPALAFKIDSRNAPSLPSPRPYREIFVYSPKVEGIHLRGDKIARGGLRWSDRPDDFRTEVLGLMKAQQVKNSIIVPMGAKGGFVVRESQPGLDRNGLYEEGVNRYKLFIGALIDVTDNRKGTQIIPPKDVVCHDEVDPYLVVAADKGTAKFSDIANAISLERDFWFGDAFASGGSAGYDHKVMGITARGGWEAVKRHFREMGHNCQTQPFDCIGVGDMGGDVFGNGMLLSEQTRLIGAFNHVHIFLDPNPDVAKSFAERQRLFDAVKGWDEYNTDLLSKGGRIFNRSEKSLKLTPEIRERFGIQAEEISPDELMKTMLKTKCDLLWFGGIGTYIKAQSETNVEVGDKANNAVRIDGFEVGASIIGEGANLALTQKARIEMALNGVRINTDFIDNSAGVDSSDHEVNIKLLLQDVLAAKKLNEKSRNKLLADMTEAVASHVLRNNYLQTQALSLMEYRAVPMLQNQTRLIETLEHHGHLDRAIEFLPTNEEIAQRSRLGKALTRPELAVLQSYAKIELSRSILASDIPDRADTQFWAEHYFPPQIQKSYPAYIKSHQLKREIIATYLAGEVINRAGPSYVDDAIQKTGASVEDVVMAFSLISRLYDLPVLWKAIESLDGEVSAQVQLKALSDIADLIWTLTLWVLRNVSDLPDLHQHGDKIAAKLADLRQKLIGSLTEQKAKAYQEHLAAYRAENVPSALAEILATVPLLGSAAELLRLSEKIKLPIDQVAKLYFAVGEAFSLDWLREQAEAQPVTDTWSDTVIDGLIDSFDQAQGDLTGQILASQKSGAKKLPEITKWVAEENAPAARTIEQIESLRAHGTLTLPMLLSAEQELRRLR